MMRSVRGHSASYRKNRKENFAKFTFLENKVTYECRRNENKRHCKPGRQRKALKNFKDFRILLRLMCHECMIIQFVRISEIDCF